VSTLAGTTVAVTGAGGFIGSHLVEALVEEGARVRALVRYNSRGDADALEWVKDEISSGVEVVYGDIRDAESAADAVSGCEIIFHLAPRIAIPYSYVNPRDFFETNVLGTLNVIQSKVGADQLALSFYHSFDLPITVLRPFNTYGPRQSIRAVIPTIIAQALQGDSIRISSLEPRRDLTHVSDTVRGFIAAARAEGIVGETLQLGMGHERYAI
jgi:nucleoside-diphosphate-sugar epimerase